MQQLALSFKCEYSYKYVVFDFTTLFFSSKNQCLHISQIVGMMIVTSADVEDGKKNTVR